MSSVIAAAVELRPAPPTAARQRSLLTRLAAIIAAVLVVVFGIYAFALSAGSIRQLEDQTRAGFVSQTETLRDLIAQFDDALLGEASRFMLSLIAAVPGPYTLDEDVPVDVDGQATPMLRSGETILNANFDLPEQFSAITGGTAATVFARTGEDFILVATSLKQQDGTRAEVAMMDRNHPAYATLIKGEPHRGLAWLFGIPYASMYQPILDGDGRVAGALYVGVDVSREMDTLKERIRAKRLGTDDHFMVIDAAAGPGQGKVLAARVREGDMLIDEQDAEGRPWVRDMIAAGNGVMSHRVALDGTGTMADRLTAFAAYPGWHWIIVGTVPASSLKGELVASRNRYLAAGVVLALGVAGAFWWLLRRMVSRPLAQASAAASRIAAGDLSTRLSSQRRDEIGELMRAIDGIGTGLSGIVATVRGGASAIGGSSHQIAQGNADLSHRTAVQAATLEATVASLEQLSTTTAQNAESARNASIAVQGAVEAAREGGATIARVVDSMAGIQSDAAQIVNIIGLIDGIAFQTNILALNAAVESARAGEHGRGFAVVAGEVRTLAQRSATAAAEIKALIQRTVGNVRDGNDAVGQAGAAIDDIVARVERIAVEMDGIVTASHEQSQGIAQVQGAANEIDQATQQNAALVEQAATAAASLDRQAQELQQAVQAFRLPD